MAIGKIHPNKQGQWWLKKNYSTGNMEQCQQPIQIVSPTQQAVEQAKVKQKKRKYTGSTSQRKHKKRKIATNQKQSQKATKQSAVRKPSHNRLRGGRVNKKRKQSTAKRAQGKGKKPSAVKKNKFANLRHIYNGRS